MNTKPLQSTLSKFLGENFGKFSKSQLFFPGGNGKHLMTPLGSNISLSSEGRATEGKLRNILASQFRDPLAASRQHIPLSQLLIQEYKSGCILPS